MRLGLSLSSLDRKVLRDTMRMKGQTVAMALVMACGLAMMIMSRSLIVSLDATREAYYEEQRFADVFGALKRAPKEVARRIAMVPGVAAVEPRVRVMVRLDMEGMNEPVTGLINSVPEAGPPRLSVPYVRRGRWIDASRPGEILLGEAFAEAHGLGPGDRLTAVINGGREELTVVGIALSPEFVFEARPGEVLPDNRRFAVMWMAEDELAVAFDMDGAFNDVAVELAPGAAEEVVLAEMDRLLERYGGQGAYGRADHASHVRISDEIDVLRALSVGYPIAFLSVAAVMANSILARLVRLQREQIAQLKAFGYSNAEVGRHYFKFALVPVVLGTALGSGAGIWLGSVVVEIYKRFFRFPELGFDLDEGSVLLAFAASAAASAVGIASSVWQAVRLPPAEAMRPEPPARFRLSLAERIGVAGWLGPSARMAMRNVERRPVQAGLTCLGLSLATGLVVIPGAMQDGIEYLMRFQWDWAQRQDATMTLIEPTSWRAVPEMGHLPGVTRVEPFRAVPVRLRFGHRTRRLALTGLPEDRVLHRVLDPDGRPVIVPEEGILMSEKLAELLGARPGDWLEVQVEEGERPKRSIRIAGLITDYAGVAAYLDLEVLNRMMREGPAVSGAYLRVDPADWDTFLAESQELPRVSGVVVKEALRESFEKTTAESINFLQFLYMTFACVVAFGVVYNSARIALSERGQELATLRVLGFTPREVTGVLVGELAVLTAAGVPLGLAVGAGLSKALLDMVDTETIRMPLVLSETTFVRAALVTTVSACVSFWFVSRKIRELDLVGALKARD